MFEHDDFDVYSYDNIPLDRDCYLMDMKYMNEYEQTLLGWYDGADYKPVGYISFIAVRNIGTHSLELSWYANVHDRFHEVVVTLPKDKLIICVGSRQWDEKPRLFVDSEWLEQLYLRHYSVFVMIDAIGVKNAIQHNILSKEALIKLRDTIDMIAEKYTAISSFHLQIVYYLKATGLWGTLEQLRKNIETQEFEKRIEKLEQLQGNTL